MLIVLLVFPLLRRGGQLALKRRWSRKLVHLLGLRLEVHGRPDAAMRVANHVSWLDVFAINAAIPCAFVAKDEVREWPLIGWLCAHTETVFIRRGSRRAAHETAQTVAALMLAGVDVAAFPEGTTSTGDAVLPFHSAVLHGAILAGVGVQPVALRYTMADGSRAEAPNFCGETNLAESLWRIARAHGMTVRLDYLPARDAAGRDRRELAAELRGDIAAVLASRVAPCVSRVSRPASPLPEGGREPDGEPELAFAAAASMRQASDRG
jgi:1-acyl-sn-glycerol-3-phosphate acyltransferase